MKPILTNQQMKNVDAYTIENVGLSGSILMENAGRKCADFIKARCNIDDQITLLCGQGNNGGDGFVIARYLYTWGYDVTVYIVGKEKKLKDVASFHFDCLCKSGFSTFSFVNNETNVHFSNIVVDAMLGTGLSGNVKGPYKAIITKLNQSKSIVFSIDTPSGLSDDSGVSKLYVKASYVLTIGAYKQTLYLNDGVQFLGRTTCVDIGFPRSAYDNTYPYVFLIEQSDIVLPIRKLNSHKTDFGKVFMFAGSPGMFGAAALAAKSVLKSGAGLVKLAVPKKINPTYVSELSEVMYQQLEDDDGYIVCLEKDEFNTIAKWATNFSVGMGMGSNKDLPDILEQTVKSGKPVLVDADGINSFPLDRFKNLSNVLFTPHMMEFSRLVNVPIDELQQSPISYLREFTVKYKTTCLLKGKVTLIGTPSGDVFVTLTGNSGISTAGSGDVLSGIISGLSAQGLSLKDAAITGSYIHGLAGELASEYLTEFSVLASDIISYLPKAIKLVNN